jgi:hypothetical protein
MYYFCILFFFLFFFKITSPKKEEDKLFPLKAQLCGSVRRIGSAIQKIQVDRNAESDAILEKDLDLECDPKKSDRSEACVYVPCSVETQCYCFSKASQAEFYKPGRILQAQTSALAVGRGLEPSKIRFPNSRMLICQSLYPEKTLPYRRLNFPAAVSCLPADDI